MFFVYKLGIRKKYITVSCWILCLSTYIFGIDIPEWILESTQAELEQVELFQYPEIQHVIGLYNHPISINHARVNELLTLPSITVLDANKIISARKKKNFFSIDDFKKRSIIPSDTFYKIRQFIVVRKKKKSKSFLEYNYANDLYFNIFHTQNEFITNYGGKATQRKKQFPYTLANHTTVVEENPFHLVKYWMHYENILDKKLLQQIILGNYRIKEFEDNTVENRPLSFIPDYLWNYRIPSTILYTRPKVILNGGGAILRWRTHQLLCFTSLSQIPTHLLPSYFSVDGLEGLNLQLFGTLYKTKIFQEQYLVTYTIYYLIKPIWEPTQKVDMSNTLYGLSLQGKKNLYKYKVLFSVSEKNQLTTSDRMNYFLFLKLRYKLNNFTSNLLYKKSELGYWNPAGSIFSGSAIHSFRYDAKYRIFKKLMIKIIFSQSQNDYIQSVVHPSYVRFYMTYTIKNLKQKIGYRKNMSDSIQKYFWYSIAFDPFKQSKHELYLSHLESNSVQLQLKYTFQIILSDIIKYRLRYNGKFVSKSGNKNEHGLRHRIIYTVKNIELQFSFQHASTKKIYEKDWLHILDQISYGIQDSSTWDMKIKYYF